MLHCDNRTPTQASTQCDIRLAPTAGHEAYFAEAIEDV